MTSHLLRKCADQKSFSVDIFKQFLKLDRKDLLLYEDVKKFDGKTARKTVAEYLESHIVNSLPDQEEYEF